MRCVGLDMLAQVRLTHRHLEQILTDILKREVVFLTVRRMFDTTQLCNPSVCAHLGHNVNNLVNSQQRSQVQLFQFHPT